MKYTAHEFLRATPMVNPIDASAAAEVDGPSIDTQGYSELLIVVHLGILTATGDVSFQFQDSADDSTFADITSTSIAEKDLADGAGVFVSRIDLDKVNRYVRCQYDVDDDNTLLSVCGILVHPKYGPASQINTVDFNV